MKTPNTVLADRGFLSIAFSRRVVVQAIRIAIIVGTILALINHGEKILGMSLSGRDWFKVIISYLVPYVVSTWSAVGGIRENLSGGT